MTTSVGLLGHGPVVGTDLAGAPGVGVGKCRAGGLSIDSHDRCADCFPVYQVRGELHFIGLAGDGRPGKLDAILGTEQLGDAEVIGGIVSVGACDGFVGIGDARSSGLVPPASEATSEALRARLQSETSSTRPVNQCEEASRRMPPMEVAFRSPSAKLPAFHPVNVSATPSM